MSMKRTVAFILCLVMLVTAMPLGVFAFPTNTEESIAADAAVEKPYGYFYKFDFDWLKENQAVSSIKWAAGDDGNPYGYKVDGLALVVKSRTDSQGNAQGKYAEVTVAAGERKFAALAHGKGGKSFVMGNTVSTEFDIRWQGVIEGTTLADNRTFNLLSFRRDNSDKYENVFLSATIVAEGETVDQYLSITTHDGKEVAKLEKGADSFKSIKTVYYDATQTYSVYVNGSPVVEAKSCAKNTVIDTFITSTYNDDGIVTSRTSIDGYGFYFCYIDNRSSNIAPCVIDFDNLCIKEEQLSDGRTAYYENSFEGTYGDLVESSTAASVAYGYTDKSKLSHKTEGSGDSENSYLGVASQGRFMVYDRYQILQNGNWTVEFDARVTSTNNNFSLFGIHDGIKHQMVLNTTTADQIRFQGGYIMRNVVSNTTMADEAGEWTHVVLSVTVDKDGANKGKHGDWSGADADSLTYSISLWVDGVYVGSANQLARAEFLASGTKVNDINGTQYTKATLTAAPTLPADDADGIHWLVNTDTLKQYVDESTGIRYCLKYNADKTFNTGVTLTPSTTKNASYWSFFDTNNYYSDGAIDNIKIYEGVYPASNAVGKNDTKGTVAEIDFGYLIRPALSTSGENLLQATQSSAGGDVGVVYFNKWHDGIITLKTQSGDRYYNLHDTTDNYLDVYTPNVGGKVFSSSVKLRNFKVTTAGTSPVSLLSVKRQAAGGTQKVLDVLKVDDSGNLYFTKGASSLYLCDKDGRLYSASGTDWITVQTIIDETGDTPRVSYLVNGNAVYYKYASFPYVFNGTNIEGVITNEVTALKDAIDQRICVLQVADSTISVDLDFFKTELVENTFPIVKYEWEDSAMIDFSDYDSIEDLGPQFYWTHAATENVEIRDGVLYIPDGATFGWVDMNGTLIDFVEDFDNTNDDSFHVELKMRTTKKSGNVGLVSVICNDGTTKNVINIKNNKIVVGSNGTADGEISALGSGKFTDVRATYRANKNAPTYFIDGALIGVQNGGVGTAVEGKELVAFQIASGTEVSELYIHRDVQSELAKKTGDLITLDPNVVSTTIGSGKPTNGISISIFTEANTITDDEGYKYYSFNNTPGAAFVPLTGYLEDSVTVFETSVKFTPDADATASTAKIALFDLLRTDSVGGTELTEETVAITPFGGLTTPYGILYEADGSELVISETEWQNVAVIYDAAAGRISYRVDGKIPYYKNGDELIPADKIQLKNSRYYRMDADATRLRTVYFRSASLGKLDVKYIKAYTVNESANVEFIGTQVSTTDGDIRIIAGIDMLYYGCAGFDVKGYGYDELGNPKDGESIIPANTAYSSITEIVNSTENVVYPEEYGYRYFLIGKITNIPQDKAVTLEITPYTMTNGKKSSSDKILLKVDFTELDMNNWVCATDCVSVKPEGDNIKANFSTTEYVAYTKDGALELNGLNAEFAFAANCEGQVSVDLTNAFGEAATASLFDVYVNGVLTKENISLDFGHHTFVLADNLAKGDYSFKLVKKSGGDFVKIESMNFCGKIGKAPLLVKENAVDVVVSKPASGKEYGNVTVYLQASEASGDYYIAYYFNYEVTAPNTEWTFDDQPTEDGASVNPGFNKSMYRIAGAKLTEKLDTPYTYDEKYYVLDPREITLAIQEVGAADYVGGWHGDENMTAVDFYLDGVKIDTTVEGKYTGTQFEMRQNSVLNRCNTLDVDVMNHNVKCLLNSKGIKLEQQIEFLTDDFKPNPTYSFLQMATYMRQNTSLSSELRELPENLLCRQTNLLNANGEINLTYDCVNDPDAYWVGLEYSDTNRYAEYIGNHEGEYVGLYGLIGFVIDDASVKAESCRLQIRSTDNKWYPSFDTYNGDTVPKGEVWNVSNSYFIDYNPELYVVSADADEPDNE